MPEPVFVVVGHPNKGKSSLVATLARDVSVQIGPEPGTTTRARRFQMTAHDGRVLYTLVDTPGFQRARAALAWMRDRETGAASRPGVVGQFVAACDAGLLDFPDESALLGPVIDPDHPAGILYVVDGARPYGPEYEAEMQILRWTGRPSLAIINPIGPGGPGGAEGGAHLDAWRDALGQFFRVVRVMDVLKAPPDQQADLLRAFGQMHDGWRRPLDEAVAALTSDRDRRRRAAAQVIARMLADMLTHTETRRIGPDDEPAPHRAALEEAYRGWLRKTERAARAEVEAIYGHGGLDRREAQARRLNLDLLARDTWLAFGLRRRDLATAGAAGGAVAGGVLDASLLGASFLTGSVIGAGLGAAAGYFGSVKLARARVLHQPLGGRRLVCGPARNRHFPFVVLARARLHHALVAGRTHARRDPLTVPDTDGTPTPGPTPLPRPDQQDLAAGFERISRRHTGRPLPDGDLDKLATTLDRLLESDRA